MKTIAARQQSQNQNAPPAEPEAWWTLPAVWAMGAVILILTLVLMMVVARQRREKQAEIDAFLSEDAAPAASAESAVAFASDELDIEAEDDEDDDLMRAGLDASDGEVDADSDGDWPADEEDDAGVAPATGDVLAEADIYIAYERFPQAVSLLKGALDKDPDRDDARLKLLEVHAETGDQSAFETQLAELEQRCDDSEILLAARELQSRFESDAPVSLDDLDDVPDVAASTDRTTSADGPDVEETDGDMLDDFELTLDDDGETSGLDFELELDGGDTDETEESVATRADADEDDGAGAGDQLGGDLGMDFDPDRDVSDTGAVTPAAVATTLEVDDDLDLLTDESDDEFDFFDDADAATTKLDLARAYIDMGDSDGARDILQEVIGEGSSEQQKQARDLLGQI